MGIVGNAQDATTIRDYLVALRKWQYGGWSPDKGPSPVTPKGWSYLGSGCYREAWLSPDGTVYKVPYEWGRDLGQSNASEAANGIRILTQCRLPEHVRLPRFTCYALDGRNVMAMEYVERTQDSQPEIPWHELRWTVQARAGIGDLHNGNVRWNGSEWVVTDFAD